MIDWLFTGMPWEQALIFGLLVTAAMLFYGARQTEQERDRLKAENDALKAQLRK